MWVNNQQSGSHRCRQRLTLLNTTTGFERCHFRTCLFHCGISTGWPASSAGSINISGFRSDGSGACLVDSLYNKPCTTRRFVDLVQHLRRTWSSSTLRLCPDVDQSSTSDGGLLYCHQSKAPIMSAKMVIAIFCLPRMSQPFDTYGLS